MKEQHIRYNTPTKTSKSWQMCCLVHDGLPATVPCHADHHDEPASCWQVQKDWYLLWLH